MDFARVSKGSMGRNCVRRSSQRWRRLPSYLGHHFRGFVRHLRGVSFANGFALVALRTLFLGVRNVQLRANENARATRPANTRIRVFWPQPIADEFLWNPKHQPKYGSNSRNTAARNNPPLAIPRNAGAIAAHENGRP